MKKNSHPRLALLVAGLCALVLATGVDGATAAGGGAERTGHSRSGGLSSTHDREQIVAVAGSSRFLVYIEYATVDGQRSKTAGLYERTAQGTTRKLGTVRAVLDDAALQNFYSIAGRYLATGQVDSPNVRVWNLNNGREYDRTVPQHMEQLVAAPHGYLVAKFEPGQPGFQLVTVSLSGAVRSLGNPFPHGDSYGVTVNAHRYVAFRNVGEPRPWGARTATFAHPHHVTTLIGGHGRTSTPTTYCGVPSTHFVACDTDSNRYRLQVYNLDGTLVSHTSKYDVNYAPAPAMLAGSAFWITQAPDRRLRQLTTSGTLIDSKRKFAHDGPIHAFHEIIVGARGKRALLEVKSAASKPAALVTPKNSK